MIDLVTGGAASGKSEYAEGLVMGADSRVYLAAMWNDGSESARYRIARHRKLREGKGFRTLECPSHLEQISSVTSSHAVLLEDLPNLLTNEMYRESRSADDVLSSILKLDQAAGQLVIVTAQIFSDGRTYDPFTEEFMKNLAFLNREIACLSACRSVTEVVCGIPVHLKG